MNRSAIVPEEPASVQLTMPCDVWENYETPKKTSEAEQEDSGYKSQPIRLQVVAKQRSFQHGKVWSRDPTDFVQRNIHNLALLVVLSSICFGLFIGKEVEERRNMKYESLQYGRPGKWQHIGLDLRGDEGEVLGGKRAAIQFYYNKIFGRGEEDQKFEGAIAAAEEAFQ